MDVTVEPLRANQRDAVCALEPRSAFVAPVARYLAMCDEGPWRAFAILDGDDVAGFVMTAPDHTEDSTWIGGLVVDAGRQGRGIGRAALEQLIAMHPGPLAISYRAENEVARGLYAALGFAETGETLDNGELIARLAR